MDILFENNYIRTDGHSEEIYKYFYFKRPLVIFFNVLIILLNLAYLFISQYVSYFLIFITLLFFALQIIRYFKTVKIMKKRDIEINNGNPISTNIVVTDEFMRYTTSNSSPAEIPYSKIKKIVQTKNLIVLWSEANLLYMFEKNAFTKGTPLEFIAFLKQKGFKC